jgi:hypothetical protein
MFGISVGGSRVDVRSNGGVIEVRNYTGVWRSIQTAVHLGVAAPVVTDDASLGFLETDLWFFGTALYLCVDNTIGAAVWTQIAGGGGNLDDVLVAVDSSIIVDESGNIVTRG